MTPKPTTHARAHTHNGTTIFRLRSIRRNVIWEFFFLFPCVARCTWHRLCTDLALSPSFFGFQTKEKNDKMIITETRFLLGSYTIVCLSSLKFVVIRPARQSNRMINRASMAPTTLTHQIHIVCALPSASARSRPLCSASHRILWCVSLIYV